MPLTVSVSSLSGFLIMTFLLAQTNRRPDLSGRLFRSNQDCESLFFLALVLLVAILFLRALLAGALLEGGAQDVAEAGAGVRRAVLGDGILFLGDFARLDRERDLAAGLVDAGDHRVELVADAEALGTLVVAVARQVGAADEGLHAVGQRRLDAAVVHFRHRDGDDATLLERGAAGARLLHRIVGELLDTEADAFFLRIDVEHLGL